MPFRLSIGDMCTACKVHKGINHEYIMCENSIYMYAASRSDIKIPDNKVSLPTEINLLLLFTDC